MSIEDLQEEIEELKQERDELQSELNNHSDELSVSKQEGFDKAMREIESVIEHSFNGGFEAGFNEATDAGKLKAFLNYQMEQRL